MKKLFLLLTLTSLHWVFTACQKTPGLPKNSSLVSSAFMTQAQSDQLSANLIGIWEPDSLSLSDQANQSWDESSKQFANIAYQILPDTTTFEGRSFVFNSDGTGRRLVKFSTGSLVKTESVVESAFTWTLATCDQSQRAGLSPISLFTNMQCLTITYLPASAETTLTLKVLVNQDDVLRLTRKNYSNQFMLIEYRKIPVLVEPVIPAVDSVRHRTQRYSFGIG